MGNATSAPCQDYWRRVLTMAAAASRLCRDNKTVAEDEAYTAGLLADAGMLLFAQVDCDRYVPLYVENTHGPQLLSAEREQMGFDHAALGSRLLQSWNLPDRLTMAVQRHHSEQRYDSHLQKALVAADMLGDALWVRGTTRIAEARRFLSDEFYLDLDGFISLAVECKNDILANAALFRVKLAGSINCNDLSKRALSKYRSEAIDTALDLDSLIAVVEGDHS